jgi:hypothetical protein
VPIPGQVASALARPAGCGFAARCAHVEPGRCTSEAIPVLPVAGESGHAAQCVGAAELPPWERRRVVADPVSDPARRPGRAEGRGSEKLYRPRPGIFGSERMPVRALNGIDLVVRRARPWRSSASPDAASRRAGQSAGRARDGERRPRGDRRDGGGLEACRVTASGS